MALNREEEHPQDLLAQQLHSVKAMGTALQTRHRRWVNNIKLLRKLMLREQRRLAVAKIKRVVVQKPQKVKKSMRLFMIKHCNEPVEHGERYTRQLMMRTVCKFIKSQDIQNPEDRKLWSGKHPVLRRLLSLKKDWYSFMQINGLLSRVIV